MVLFKASKSLDHRALAIGELCISTNPRPALRDLQADLVADDVAHEEAKALVLFHSRVPSRLHMKVKAPRVGAVVPNDGVGAIEAAHGLIDVGRLGRTQRRGRNGIGWRTSFGHGLTLPRCARPPDHERNRFRLKTIIVLFRNEIFALLPGVERKVELVFSRP